MSDKGSILRELKNLKDFNESYAIEDMLNELHRENPKLYNNKWLNEQKLLYEDLKEKVSTQKLYKSKGKISKIATLENGVYHKPSKMITARFEFCDRWTGAYIMDWLGVGDIENVWKSTKILKDINALKLNWKGSAPSLFSFAELTIFGYDKNEKNFTFLVWKKEVEEPEIWFYNGQGFKKFKNLLLFIKHIV